MSLFSEIDRKFPWSFLGFIAAIIFGGFGIYTVFFYHTNPDLRMEVANDAPVFSLREQVTGLEIMFRGANIRESHQGLSILTLRIANRGNVAIRKRVSS